METLNAWWDGLDLILRIFYTIGMLSTAILGVQTLMMLLGIGDHSDMDMDGGGIDIIDHSGELPSDADNGVGVLSIRTITAFLVGFGWVGAISLSSGFNLIVACLLALAVGFILMFTIYWIMKFFWSMREEGTLDYANAIGEVGQVYLPIPGNKEKAGQIEVMVQGRLQVIPAWTSKPDRIENREKVLVVSLNEDNSLQVIPYDGVG